MGPLVVLTADAELIAYVLRRARKGVPLVGPVPAIRHRNWPLAHNVFFTCRRSVYTPKGIK